MCARVREFLCSRCATLVGSIPDAKEQRRAAGKRKIENGKRKMENWRVSGGLSMCLRAAEALCCEVKWRRRRDLNPRDPFGSNGFQDRRFQPLTHSSG